MIYTHPSNTFNEFQDLLLLTLNKMDHEKYDYFLCSDFNDDILKHESKKNIDNYLNALYSEGCNNVTNKPTHITESSATLLDHMCIKTTNSITNRGILTYEISDHLPTFCILAKRPLYCAPDKIMIRDVKKFNRDNFLDDISNLSLKINALILGNKDYCSNKTMTQF